MIHEEIRTVSEERILENIDDLCQWFTTTRDLKGQIAKLDKEIAEIKKLKDEISALLARKQIIETLQADRAQTVHLARCRRACI